MLEFVDCDCVMGVKWTRNSSSNFWGQVLRAITFPWLWGKLTVPLFLHEEKPACLTCFRTFADMFLF